MKVMIDTNIFISAAITPNGNAAKAFIMAMLMKKLQTALDEQIFEDPCRDMYIL